MKPLCAQKGCYQQTETTIVHGHKILELLFFRCTTILSCEFEGMNVQFIVVLFYWLFLQFWRQNKLTIFVIRTRESYVWTKTSTNRPATNTNSGCGPIAKSLFDRAQ